MSFSIGFLSILVVLFIANTSFAATDEGVIKASLGYTLEGTNLTLCFPEVINVFNRMILNSLNMIMLDHEEEEDFDGANIQFETASVTSEEMEIIPVPIDEGANRRDLSTVSRPRRAYTLVGIHLSLYGYCLWCKKDSNLYNDANRRGLRGLQTETEGDDDSAVTSFDATIDASLSEVFGALLMSKAQKYPCLSGLTAVSVFME